jgi:hypothetical protein
MAVEIGKSCGNSLPYRKKLRHSVAFGIPQRFSADTLGSCEGSSGGGTANSLPRRQSVFRASWMVSRNLSSGSALRLRGGTAWDEFSF